MAVNTTQSARIQELDEVCTPTSASDGMCTATRASGHRGTRLALSRLGFFLGQRREKLGALDGLVWARVVRSGERSHTFISYTNRPPPLPRRRWAA